MSIKNNKIAIFPNINDEPIAPNSSQSCNGSYLIDRFNKSVDSLSNLLEYQENYHPQAIVEIYIDTVNGDDNNSGLSINEQGNYIPSPETQAVKTLKRGIEIASLYTAVSYARIYIYKTVSWNLTSQTIFDFSALKAVPYSDWEDIELGYSILPWTPSGQPACNTDLLYDTTQDMGLLAPWIILPIDDQTYISFRVWKFISNNRPLPVFGNRLKFDQCLFSAIENAYDSCLWIQDCQSPILEQCTFMLDGANIWAFIIFYNCNIGFFELPPRCVDNQFNWSLANKVFIGAEKSFLHQVLIEDFNNVLPDTLTTSQIDVWYGYAKIQHLKNSQVNNYTFNSFA